MITIDEFRSRRKSYDVDINTVKIPLLDLELRVIPTNPSSPYIKDAPVVLLKKGVVKAHVYTVLYPPPGIEERFAIFEYPDRFEPEWHKDIPSVAPSLAIAEDRLFNEYNIQRSLSFAMQQA